MDTTNDLRAAAVDLTAAGVSVTATYGVDSTLPFEISRVDENGAETPIDLTGATFVATATRESGPAPGSTLAQDSVSVTLVSEETGLQVVWVFNRIFEWKGDEQ